MTTPTKAELAARVAELEAQNQQLRDRPARARYSTGMWDNQNRRTHRDPEYTGTVRMIVPADKEAGDPLWIDLSQWVYDPETSPVQYKKNPPTLSVSLSPCPVARELELEADHQKARRAS